MATSASGGRFWQIIYSQPRGTPVLAAHSSPPWPGIQLGDTLTPGCPADRAGEGWSSDSRDLSLNFSHASTAVTAPGVLDERGMGF